MTRPERFFARVRFEGAPRWARVEGDQATLLMGTPWDLPADENVIDFREGSLLAPAQPGKIICVGRNYAAHAKELGNEVPEEPKLFMKPPSSVIGPGQAIVRPTHMSGLVHHEGELALIIGRPLSHADEAQAARAIFGYTCANDVTARDLQRKDQAFTRGKGFDTFCPVGPWIVPAAQLDPSALEVKLDVIRGGETLERQRGNTRDMVFPVPFLVSFISKIMRLEPGDLILTGTPEGVGDLLAGDEVRVEVDGIGALANPVRDR